MKATIELYENELETLRSFYEDGMLMSDFSNADEDEVIYKILQAFGAEVSMPPHQEEEACDECGATKEDGKGDVYVRETLDRLCDDCWGEITKREEP